jgi:AraC-like DNA-binding protein
MLFTAANLLQIALMAVAAIGVALTLHSARLRAATALMAMSGLWMGFNLLEEAFGARQVWLVTPAFRLLYPPLCYLLVRGLVFSGPAIRWTDWPHGLAFVIALFMTPHLGLLEHAARLSLLAYGAAAIWLLHRFHRTNASRRSDAATIRLHGLYGVIAVFAAVSAFDVIRMDAHWLHDDWPWLASPSAYAVQLTVSLAMLVVLVFIAVRREAMFDGLAPDALAPLAEADPVEDQALTQDFEHLDATVRSQQLYAEPRLTRAEVAQATGLPERRVSLLIRSATGRMFNDYINAMRIEDVQAMMRDDCAAGRRSRFLDLAYTAGFSSKSVFNAVFKRETGTTPSAYAAALKAED